MVDPGIVRRVACAKFLLAKGVTALSAGGPFCAGLAVLSFQDATEMLLGAIGEHIHAQIKDSMAFNALLDSIDATGNAKLTHRTALIQLNKSRVHFKHHGLEPVLADVLKFRADLDAFFPISVRAFLGMDYERISLTDLIQHTRTRNWLRDAERSLENGKLADCVFESAVSLAITLRRKTRNKYRQSIQPHAEFTPSGNDYGPLTALLETAKAVDRELRRIDRDLYLLSSGVRLSDLERFRDMTPHIFFTTDESPHGNFSHGTDFDDEQARFCVEFVQDTVLKTQGQYASLDRFRAPRPGARLEVVNTTPVFVYPPGGKRDSEVLFEAAPGSVLVQCASMRGTEKGFLPILVDGDAAYVADQDVKEVGA